MQEDWIRKGMILLMSDQPSLTQGLGLRWTPCTGVMAVSRQKQMGTMHEHRSSGVGGKAGGTSPGSCT
eukprot:scaffold264940_cov22-Tisochrysis_lutea.AAC.2